MRFSALLLLAASALAQQQGITPEYDIGKVFLAISEHARRLLPMIEQVDPKPWVAKGAPEAYIAQWDSARVQAKAIVDAAQALSRTPGKLSPAIELTYRIQALETALMSLGAGMRRYHNPAVAELIAGVVSENGADRERLQQYVVELAADKETECAIADTEAQRCRGLLSRQTPPAARRPATQQPKMK